MISIEGLKNFPIIKNKCDLEKVILKNIEEQNFELKNGDILCISSKMCSIAGGYTVDLTKVIPTKVAKEIQKKVPRKSKELIQVIIDQTKDKTGKRLQILDNYIGGWLPNGLFLTSAGVDRQGKNKAVTLPKNCDVVAKKIGITLNHTFKIKIGIIITDSDGRADKKGSNQIAVGLYGVPGLKVSTNHEKNMLKLYVICSQMQLDW